MTKSTKTSWTANELFELLDGCFKACRIKGEGNSKEWKAGMASAFLVIHSHIAQEMNGDE